MLIKKLLISLFVFGISINLLADVKTCNNVSGKFLYVGNWIEGNMSKALCNKFILRVGSPPVKEALLIPMLL